MKIKEKIKKYDLTLTELSKLLSLSRPTLNNYIRLYEENQKIQNEIYDQLFKKIFKKEFDTKDLFLEEISSNIALINKEKNEEGLIPTFTSENIDLIKTIQNKMEKDLKGQNTDNALYKFISSAIYNYNKNPPLTAYINYNLYLNGLKDLNRIKAKEKKLISNLFPIMKLYSQSKLEFNEEGYNQFLNRVKDIKESRKKKITDIEKEIKKKIEIEFKKKIQQGISAEDIDIEDLMKNI